MPSTLRSNLVLLLLVMEAHLVLIMVQDLEPIVLVCEPLDLQLAAPCSESPWLPELVSGPEVAEMALSAKNAFYFRFCVFSVFPEFFLRTTNFSSYDEYFLLKKKF